MAVYNWRATLTFEAGDPGELSHGVTPSTQENWQTSTIGGTRSGNYTYWYRDSNTMWSGAFRDVLSSRVALNVTQSWTTSVDSQNNLTVVVGTKVMSIVRDDVRHPSGYYDSNTPGRSINLYQSDGSLLFSTVDNQVATAHTISGELGLVTETFVLAPGDSTVVQTSLYLHNQTVGGASYDDIWIGVQFRNPLPKDYRPGATLNGVNGIWSSHNRVNGACHILPNATGVNWQECRTTDGDSGGQGNPPLILHSANANSWYNQKKLGKE